LPGLPGLEPLTLDLVKAAALTGARAFADDPTTLYLIPNPEKRPNLHYAFEYYFRLSVLNGDEAYVTSRDCEGVATWMHSTERGSVFNIFRAGWPWLSLRCGWTYLFRDALMERRYDRLREELAPKPHMYLGLLAVAPSFQGRGFASKLIRPILARLDAEKMAAYVETQNLKNVAMYQHFGFTLLKEDIMPGAGFHMYLMARLPLSASSAQDNLP